MIRRRYLAAGVAALALGIATLVWDRTPDKLPAAAVDIDTSPQSDILPTATPAAPMQPVAAGSQATSPALARSTLEPKGAAAAQLVTLTVAATRELRVGDQKDLVLSMSSGSEVGEITFTVQFDGNVLQVRNGAEGDWATVTGSTAQFTTDISGAEDRIQVRSAVMSPRLAAASSSIALVQFQAVAPGVSSVMISDVKVKDRTGRAMPFVVSPPILQITAESGAPPS